MTGRDAARFTGSASGHGTSQSTDDEIWEWWTGLPREDAFEVAPIPFDRMRGWGFDDKGNLVHDSGRFFSIEGLRIDTDDGVITQPIIDQPEVGILGLLMKDIGGTPHFLMQAKFEPGNLNVRQLSPTVQATRSNYIGVHNGRATPYVEHFRSAPRERVLVDVLQSEQGEWFWRKRNRNMVVEVEGDVEEREGFRWLTLAQINRLMSTDDVINMDARTVLACLPLAPAEEPGPGEPDDAFVRALRRSYHVKDDDPAAANTLAGIVGLLTDVKVACTRDRRLVPLTEVEGWSITDEEIVDDARREFRVMAVDVRAEGREVGRWTQPLLEPHDVHTAVFLTKDIGGVLHVLLATRAEPGLADMVEFGPTVRLRSPEEDPGLPEGFAEALALDDPERVRRDVVLSEEGGRFRAARTRYRVIDAGGILPDRAPEGHCWATVGQLTELVRHGGYLTIEARTLLACLHGLW